MWFYLLCALLFFSEAREAFIKQFSLLEASTGSLLAQLHGITATLNCSISTAEAEGKERRKDDVCQTFEGTATMIRASQQQLKQATLDLDSMVHKWNTLKSSNLCRYSRYGTVALKAHVLQKLTTQYKCFWGYIFEIKPETFKVDVLPNLD